MVTIVGPGASDAFTQLRDLAVAAGHPVHLEAAPLAEHRFVPFLVRGSSTSLLFPKGGESSINDWVLGMVGDPGDLSQLAAEADLIAEQFSIRDFVAVPGGFNIEPLPRKVR